MIGQHKTVHALEVSPSTGKKPRYNDNGTVEDNTRQFRREHCGPHFQPAPDTEDMTSKSLPHSEEEDNMILDDGFQPPKNPIRQPRTPAPTPTSTSNQFSVLSDKSDNHAASQDPQHSAKPGTLFIYCRQHKYVMTQKITSMTKHPIRISHNAEGIIVNAKTPQDQQRIIQYCQENNIEFATQKAKHEQPIKVIIRKLPTAFGQRQTKR